MSQKIPQVRKLMFNDEQIGMGFNSDTGAAVGTALDFDPPTRESGQEGPAAVTIVTTHEALMEALDMSAELKGHYAFSSADMKVDFTKKTQYNSISTFVVASFVLENQITRGTNFRITPGGKGSSGQPSDRGVPNGFRRLLCAGH